MNKYISRVLLLIALGLGNLNSQVLANENLARCLTNQETAKILASISDNQFSYYLLEVKPLQAESYTSVFKLDKSGQCYVAVEEQQIFSYPLSKFLDKEIAENLLFNKYQTLINDLGGKEAFINYLVEELDADTPHPFFFDEVEALERLGVNLKEIDPSLVIVGLEGIPAHPELNYQN